MGESSPNPKSLATYFLSCFELAYISDPGWNDEGERSSYEESGESAGDHAHSSTARKGQRGS